jgi:hypothetical protein
MVGQGLAEVVSEIPAPRKAVGHNPHELALGAQILKEHHKLELEEDNRIHRRAATAGVERMYQLPDEREIQRHL